jgi:hypothetical protein
MGSAGARTGDEGWPLLPGRKPRRHRTSPKPVLFCLSHQMESYRYSEHFLVFAASFLNSPRWHGPISSAFWLRPCHKNAPLPRGTPPFSQGSVKLSEVHDSWHGESCLECGGLPPLWARRLGGAPGPEASFRPESGSTLPQSMCQTLTGPCTFPLTRRTELGWRAQNEFLRFSKGTRIAERCR